MYIDAVTVTGWNANIEWVKLKEAETLSRAKYVVSLLLHSIISQFLFLCDAN